MVEVQSVFDRRVVERDATSPDMTWLSKSKGNGAEFGWAITGTKTEHWT